MSAGRCANHPSREAALRCRVCGRPLCRRCARTTGDQVHCSARCLVIGVLGDAARAVRRAALAPVPAPWAIALTAAAAALLLAAIARHAATLLEVAGPAPATASARRRPHPSLEARLVREGRTWTVEIRTAPGAAALVVVGGRPTAVVTADRDGRARLPGLRLRRGRAAVEVVPLAGGGVPATAASPTPTATPTPTPTATPTPTPTATPTPSPTPSPTPTATATPTPTPTRNPRPPHRPAVATPPPRLVSPTRRPGRRRRVPDLELVLDAGPRIALTFDGGSDGDGAADVLDVLRRLRVRATLFLTGSFIEAHPDLVRRAVLEGHEVGNHTMRHPHLTTYGRDRRQRLRPGLTREAFRRELLEAERAFLAATGRPMAPLWRAPYGEENATLRRWAAELGYVHVRWSLLRGHSLDARDWVADEHSPLYEDADRMVRRLLAFPHLDGGIVLLHLASRRRHPAWRKLPDLVRDLRARGLEPVPVTALLEASPTWAPRLAAAERRHRATLRRLRRPGTR